ncbi:permease prefix domain 1-containing protein [Pseudobacillus sp. 179-B 2D1 NHS]|uniref:permease prefix domain 1-containing protein n=1 Tax=Pseudobacillus sp. 179-B 2D1 NHS TaxID=3374292 RepID=UPI003879CF2D
MKSRIKEYIEQVFADFPPSNQLNELKEEVEVNLQERIQEFTNQGMNEEEAFQKAISQLGDVTKVAEDIGIKAHYEVIDHMYNKKPLPKVHVFGYVISIGILLFGMITALLVHLRMEEYYITISTLFPFALVSISALVYLGLTQETPHHFGMRPIRAAGYTAATGVLLFGLFTAGIVYFQGSVENGEWVATLLPFAIPSICLYVFLGLTEKDRSKHDQEWMKYTAKYYNPEYQMIRGSISGALWIFAFATFLLIGFLISWKYAWIVFIFATGVEVLIGAIPFKQKKAL